MKFKFKQTDYIADELARPFPTKISDEIRNREDIVRSKTVYENHF